MGTGGQYFIWFMELQTFKGKEMADQSLVGLKATPVSS
jgi:hypothetical protein